MSKLEHLIVQLKNNNNQQSFQKLWAQLLSQSQKSIANTNNSVRSTLQSYLREQTLKPRQNWFKYMLQFIKIAYNRNGVLIKTMYRVLPVLIMRYIQVNYCKYQNLEQCLIEIYNWEYQGYNEAQVQRSQLCKDKGIRDLYQSNLGKQMLQPKFQLFQKIIQINNTSRIYLKCLIFYLVYREAHVFNAQSLTDYYRCLFIYCGADQKDLNTTGSLYLIQKINKVSIFRYSISQDQLQWIILTLYQLCTQVKKDKSQLLSVINVFHKKVSNEGLFKMSDVINSVVHLLQDQYSDIFI